MSGDEIRKAEEIAKRDLRACYENEGIIAGRHHFTDYWARDGLFAALGSLAIGDEEIVRKEIELFFSHQRADGLIPYRIMRGPVSIGKYLGRTTRVYENPRPTYRLRGIGAEVLDGTTLSLLILGELAERGWREASKFAKPVEKALAYLEGREKDGLLQDGLMAEWNDSTYKRGALLYSNAIYWRALGSLASLEGMGLLSRENLLAKQKFLARRIRDKLWNGRFFSDWYDWKRQDYFNSFCNLLLVAWGFTTDEEAEKILSEAEKSQISFTVENVAPWYPWWRVDVTNRIIGLPDYHNALLWWQPGIAYAVALAHEGRKSEARQQMLLMSRQALKYGGFYECYERTGLPVKRLVYKAERPFAWAAGMFLWAVD